MVGRTGSCCVPCRVPDAPCKLVRSLIGGNCFSAVHRAHETLSGRCWFLFVSTSHNISRTRGPCHCLLEKPGAGERFCFSMARMHRRCEEDRRDSPHSLHRPPQPSTTRPARLLVLARHLGSLDLLARPPCRFITGSHACHVGFAAPALQSTPPFCRHPAPPSQASTSPNLERPAFPSLAATASVQTG